MTDSVDTIILKNKDELNRKNIKILKDFDRFNLSKDLAESTRYNQTLILMKFISRTNKNFAEITRKDVESYIITRKVKVKPNSLDIDKIVLKKFYKWFKNGTYSNCVEWLELSNEYNYKKPTDMLTEEEIKKLMKKCNNLRDRAIVALLNDSAARLGEIVNLNIGDVHNDGEHLSITVSGKTGERSIGLITSSPLITELINHHPDKNNPNAPLFLSYPAKNKRISDNTVYEMLQELRERAGISKKVTSHIFRHSTLTRYARLGMNEPQMRIFAGWSDSSNMPSVYLHMTEKEVDDNRRALMTGKEIPKTIEKSKLLPIKCPRCGKDNDGDNNYCYSCWLPLSRKSVDRDVKIISTFKSKFTQMAINVDKFVDEYYNFRSTTEEYLEFYKGFGGKKSINLELLQQNLNWTKSRFERFVNGLIESGVLTIKDGKITIETYATDSGQKSVFDNFLMFQKML